MTMERRIKTLGLAAWLLAVVRSAEAAVPSLSMSLVSPDYVQASWSTNFGIESWQLLP